MARVCSKPGCPTIYDGITSRCPQHEAAAKRQHWDRTRAYSSKGHRTFRAAVLRRDPICVICQLREATVADHYPKGRQQLIDLGLNANDPQHGRGLCKPCHDSSTAQEFPSGWNAR